MHEKTKARNRLHSWLIERMCLLLQGESEDRVVSAKIVIYLPDYTVSY
jgi:hypothetical protein